MRVQTYEGQKDQWFAEAFLPSFNYIEIAALASENVIAAIGQSDRAASEEIGAFYDRCLQFNGPTPKNRS